MLVGINLCQQNKSPLAGQYIIFTKILKKNCQEKFVEKCDVFILLF